MLLVSASRIRAVSLRKFADLLVDRSSLWFLTRQWQFGEFEGDAAGSPIDARIAYETAPLDGYRSGADILPYDG